MSEVVPEYAPISKNQQTKQNKSPKTTNETHNPSPPHPTQLKGSWNSSAVKKARETGYGLRSPFRN